MTSVVLRGKVPGVARAEVRQLDDRRVVWLEVTADSHRGALSSESSSMIETCRGPLCFSASSITSS
ncbi:MAG: hypothetical protein EBY07_05520 [Actinobacteria bacterium]|nr:hypothetical protein [Actinomycetota bacterium]